jgi:DNA-binding response OmpR family regulator
VTTTNEDSIIIFDEVSLIRQRVNNLLQEYNIHVFETSYDMELFNLLSDSKLNISLIIMDIGYDVNKGFKILSRINEKRLNIPVFILTSNNKRETFIRGIAEGAADYILKPFDDDYLLEKILCVFNKRRKDSGLQFDSKSEIIFDIQSYLTLECKKAVKGKYEITVLMCSLYIPDEETNNKVENRYKQVSDLFYNRFESIIWETDIFVRYGARTFIGIFPYCGSNNADKVKNKLLNSLENVKKINKELMPFHLNISTIIYPSEEKEPKELLLSLGTRMQEEIEEKKKVKIEDASTNASI